MIAIIDSGGANIASVQFALERLGVAAELTADPDRIVNADKVLLPGVGAAPNAMQMLAERDLIACIRQLQQPVLGICLGMQLLFEHSAESDTDMLGLVEGRCGLFPPDTGLTVPHMGWNRIRSLEVSNRHPLMKEVEEGAHVYFVHSYFAPLTGDTVAYADYGHSFTAMVANDNLMGCQFHPERSGPVGAQILKNFVAL